MNFSVEPVVVSAYGSDVMTSCWRPRPELFDVPCAAHHHAADAGAVDVGHLVAVGDRALLRERRPRQELHQLVDRRLRVGDQVQRGGAHLARVVRRQVRRQADSDAVGAVHQQVGERGREDHGLLGGALVVLDHRHGALVDVVEQQHAGEAEAGLGVAGGSGGEVGAAVVAVEVEQRHEVGERLGQAGERVGDRLVAVGVEQRHGVADHACRLHERPVGEQALHVHVPQDPAVHRLESVGGRWHGPVLDDLLAVGEVVAVELLDRGQVDDDLLEVGGGRPLGPLAGLGVP